MMVGVHSSLNQKDHEEKGKKKRFYNQKHAEKTKRKRYWGQFVMTEQKAK